MTRPWRQGILRSLRRRLTTGLALAAYFVTTIGLPIPVVPAKSGDRPFPCQDRLCGCQTLADCGTGCCCSSPEEKQAWAAEQAPVETSPPCPHCQAAAASPDATGDAPSEPCCQSGCCKPPPGRAGADDRPPPVRVVVLGLAAKKCQGVATVWVSCGAVLLPPPVSWAVFTPAPDWPTPFAVIVTSLVPIPPDPPPRTVGA